VIACVHERSRSCDGRVRTQGLYTLSVLIGAAGTHVLGLDHIKVRPPLQQRIPPRRALVFVPI
jgi:hypothetical protein